MNAQAVDLLEAPAHYRSQMPSIWSQTYSFTQGQDASATLARRKEALDHYAGRPTIALAFAESSDFTYEHVALTPTRTVKTQYQFIGRLPPREYSFDE